MFGVDAPALIEMIKRELEKEIRVLKENEERKSVQDDHSSCSSLEKNIKILIKKQKIKYF